MPEMSVSVVSLDSVLAGQCGDARVNGNRILLVPGEYVASFSFAAPARATRSTLANVARFAVADQLADAPEDLHMVTVSGAGSPHVLAVDRGLMETWVAELGSLQHKMKVMLPDYLALPQIEGGWSVVREKSRILARTGPFAGFAGEPELAAMALDLLAEQQAPRRIMLRDNTANSDADAFSDFLKRMTEADIPLEAGDDELFEERPDNDAIAANLLANNFRRRSRLLQMGKPWIPVAATVAGLLVIQGAGEGLRIGRANAEISRLDSQITRIYRESFSPDGPIIDIRRQAERQLDMEKSVAGAKAASFQSLLRAAAPLLMEDKLIVRAMQYRENALHIDLLVRSFRDLEDLRDKLEAKSLGVQTASSSSFDGRVQASLIIHGRAQDG